jgi:mRNA interferase YafO|tara:strand:- start:53393 stop:53854 length:462 start_codon:yes stop_codon:yes gene_type:complete
MRSGSKKHVDVSFHPKTKHLFEEFSRDFPDLLASLETDFTDYMMYIIGKSDYIPNRFGKFEPYRKPNVIASSGLMHIHICVPPRTGFTSNYLAQRVCRIDEPHADAALVYAQHAYDEEKYCILALLYPHAHAKGNEDDLIQFLARLAREFREN